MGSYRMTEREKWVDHYAKAENFRRVFDDYAKLKAVKRTTAQHIQFAALNEVIDGKLCL